MREMQAKIVEEMGVKPTIDPAEEIETRVQFLVDYARNAHSKGFVLGISGGVDSTLAGRLAQLAVQRMGDDAQFVAVRLPHGVQADEGDAQNALAFIEASREVTINIKESVDGMERAYEEGMGVEISDFNRGNVKARARMIAQYAIAGDHGLLVIGTDQAAESTMGFFTKFGDGGADLLPLYGLTKRQIRQLLQHLGAAPVVYEKVPTADLLDDRPLRPDEDEMGVRYDDLDDYLEGKEIDEAVAGKIEQTWLRSRHKRTTPPAPFDDWWR